jgi:hypothetical protein
MYTENKFNDSYQTKMANNMGVAEIIHKYIQDISTTNWKVKANMKWVLLVKLKDYRNTPGLLILLDWKYEIKSMSELITWCHGGVKWVHYHFQQDKL